MSKSRGERLRDSFRDLPLTGSQTEAVGRLEQFMAGSSEVFILKGYAGTGKTFMLARLSRYLEGTGCPFHLIAPTGRAAKVLRKKAGYSSHTIHSLIYELDPKRSILELDEEGEGQGQEDYKLIFKLRDNQDPADTIYIVDEASMISDTYSESESLKFGSGKLLTDLMSYRRMGGGRRKVLFIGDYAQLPPVNSKLSPALSADYLHECFQLRCEAYEMTDVYRQAQDSGILRASIELRSSLSRFDYDRLVLEDNGKDLEEIAIEQSVETFRSLWTPQDEESVILIAETNRAVYKYNRAIRKGLGFRPDELEEGDQLLVVKNRVVNGQHLFNGDFIRVEKVCPEPEVRRIPLRGVEEPVTLVFRDLLVLAAGISGEPIRLNVKVLENLLHSTDREISRLELRALLADFRMRNPRLSPKQELFGEKLREDPYFNALQVKFGYAITGHKSQGGEWRSVLVDFRYSKSQRCEEYFRWTYTAMTRSKTQLYMIYPPRHEYKGGIQASEANSEEVQELANRIASQLQPYNFQVEDTTYHTYHLILLIRSPGGRQRAALYYNGKLEITSVRLLDEGGSGLDDRLLLMMLEEVKALHGGQGAGTGRSAGTGSGSTLQGAKEAVVSQAQQVLLGELPAYRPGRVTEHHHAVKLTGQVGDQGELVVNLYFNQAGAYTNKVHIEKGEALLNDPPALKEKLRRLR